MSLRRVLYLCVMCVAVGSPSSYALDVTDSESVVAPVRWQAVKSRHSTIGGTEERRIDRDGSGAQKAHSQQTGIGDAGDRLYIVEAGDTFRSIAARQTGSSDNGSTIATYNQKIPTAALVPGDMLVIPQALIRGRAVTPRTEHRRATTSGNGIKGMAAKAALPAPTVSERAPNSPSPALPNQTATVIGWQSTENQLAKVQPRRPSTRNAGAAVHRAKVDMFVGEIRVYEQINVNRVAVGNGKLLRAEVLDTGELLLIAEAEGSTSLRLWHQDKSQTDLNIRVGATDPETRFHRETMVRFRVKMVEFRKSALTRLGIDWSDSTAGPSFATAGDLVSNPLFRPASEGFAASLPNHIRPFTSHVGIASSLSSRIDFLATNGDAEVLAEPVLSCANGGSARFLAGGEVPYPTTGSNGQTTVEFKEYGIRLEVSPRVDEFGHIATDVLTEISSIDPAVTVQGAPGLLTRRTQTQVSVVNGETIVIAGLLKAEASKDIDKLPGIGGIPVLGRLFRSENIRNSVSELVIFITPEISAVANQPMSSGDLMTYQDGQNRLQNVQRQLDFDLIQ